MAAVDVIVAGSGPAGWAVADACARRGLAVTLVAPHPDTPWQPTYGLWADQTAALPPGARVLTATDVRACGRRLDRDYAILDNAATVAAYASGSTALVLDKAVGATYDARGATVHLGSGGDLTAAVVIDATGHRRRLSGGRPPGPQAEQSAVGVILPADVAAPLAPAGTAVFMDGWDATDGLATFLYAVPLPGNRTLVEETSLAACPAVSAETLRARLDRRLAAAGITAPADAPTERVRFPLDLPPPPRPRMRLPFGLSGAVSVHRTSSNTPLRSCAPGAVAFGAAAAMTHPATGYSVGDALATAPAVAEAIVAALPAGPAAATAAARAAVWPRAARTVHALRAHGLRALLALPPVQVPEFFGEFFALPAARQDAFLTGRADLAGTAAAMATLFASSPWKIRRKLMTFR